MWNVFRWCIAPIAGLIVAAANSPERLPAAEQKADPSNEPPTVKLVISPAPEPVPALKYRLLPRLSEQTAGNAALAYHRAVVEFGTEHRNSQNAKLVEEKYEAWAEMPLDKLPQAEVAKLLDRYKYPLKELDRAAHCDRCEWELPLTDAIYLQLDEFQNLRDPARLLALRARLQMARGDLDGALASLGTSYRLSRDLCKARTVITSLIGTAIQVITRVQFETFVQQPRAPNLYWALTYLPVPFTDFRPALETEETIIDDTFPEMARFRSQRLSPDESRRLSDLLLDKWVKSGVDEKLSKTPEEARARFAAWATHSAEAMQTLIDAGRPKAEVAAMPVEQVLWLASYRRWEVYRDDLLKWVPVSDPQRTEAVTKLDERLKTFVSKCANSAFEFTEFAPADPSAVLGASQRRDREIALLRVVEAIRLFAQTHPGKLPESLEQVDGVPIPPDPMTCKPLLYRLQGGEAVLETPRVPNKFQNRRYLISLRK